MASKNVTIRLEEDTLRLMQGFASVYQTSLNALLKTAVDEYVEATVKKPDYPDAVAQAEARQKELFDSLRLAAGP